MAAVLAAGGALLVAMRPVAFPIPTANITVSVPPGLPYQQVTSGNWDDLYPEWSPDGRLMAYVSDRGGMWSVWVMEANGSRVRQLSTPSLGAADPSWSPDSASIAVWRTDGPSASIVVINVTGGQSFVASKGIADVAMATPEWSPDGTRLLFYSADPTLRLMCVDVTSLTTRTLASVNGSDTNPSWASNDRVIYSTVEGGMYVTRWINLTSGESGLLTTGDQNSRGGVISPDGTRMAYYSDTAFPRQSTNLLNMSGYNVWVSFINLTEYDVWKSQIHGDFSSYLFEYVSEADRYRPGDVVTSDPLRWSADGKTLAVVFDNPLYGLGVYVWSVGTSIVMRPGPYTGVSMQPSWSPDASIVAFSCNATGNFHIWKYDASGAGISKGPPGY